MAKVLNYKTKKVVKNTREIVGFDFTELDEVRQVVKESIAEIQLNLSKQKRKFYGRRLYERSSFYVGRGVSNFRFYGPNIPYTKIGDVIGRIQDLYPNYKVYKLSAILDEAPCVAIVVYTRGDRKQ